MLKFFRIGWVRTLANLNEFLSITRTFAAPADEGPASRPKWDMLPLWRNVLRGSQFPESARRTVAPEIGGLEPGSEVRQARTDRPASVGRRAVKGRSERPLEPLRSSSNAFGGAVIYQVSALLRRAKGGSRMSV